MKNYRMPLYASLRNCTDRETAFRAGVYFAAALGNARANEIASDIFALESEGTNSAGGYLMDDAISDQLVLNREKYGAIRRNARIQPMSRDAMRLGRWSAGLTAYPVGGGAAGTGSTPTLAGNTLVPKKWMTLIQVSSELFTDAITTFGDYILGELGYSFALAEDNAGFNGDGTVSTYAGTRGLATALGSGQISTSASTTWGGITATELTTFMALALDYEASRDQAFYCSMPFYHNVLTRLATAVGLDCGPLINNVGVAEYFFGGYRVHLSAKLPKATATNTICAYFGDMSAAVVLGDRRQVEVARSTVGDVNSQGMFERDEISLKATERVDIVVVEPGTATAGSGPIAALSTHS